MNDPVDNIEWVDAATLEANHYNPNVVMNMELRLLQTSILKQGWVQPVLANREGVIIDGFHRWRLARDPGPVRRKYGGLLPAAFLDLSTPDAMMLTVRINRAKGSHVALRLADIILSLVDEHNCDPQDIASQMGMTAQEVELLYQNKLFKARNLKDYQYSKAWVPKETKKKST